MMSTRPGKVRELLGGVWSLSEMVKGCGIPSEPLINVSPWWQGPWERRAL